MGVERSCVPGERLCDPRLGVRATCDDCGAPQPTSDATPCVRLIASDKQSNLVCVVLGATELQCSAWAHRGSRTVPAETREVLLSNDESEETVNPESPCLRTGSDEYSCFPGSRGITRVAVGSYDSCAISDGRLFCLHSWAPGVPPDPAIDVAIAQGTLFTLGLAGVAPGDWKPRLPDFWKGTPRSLRVDDQGAGCIISTLDEMACWTHPSQPFVPSVWSGFRKWLPMTFPRACTLDAEGRMGCGNVLEDSAPTLFDTPNVVDMVTSATLACALTREGHVRCWNSEGTRSSVPLGW